MSAAEQGRVRRARHDPNVRRFAVTMLVAGLLSAIPYLMVLNDFGVDPLRTAVPSGVFSNFYDIQARAFMHGHLDVPNGSLSIEGFVEHGRTYTYFPPLPALLRIPVFAVDDAHDGLLTAPSLLCAWLLTAVIASLLIWRVRRFLRADAALGRLEALSYGVLLAAILCGSVLLYLASLPWEYHEAYGWSIACGLGALYGLLGVVERPSNRRIAVTGVFILGAVLSRATTGWACAGGAFLVALWFLLGRHGAVARRHWWRIAMAGAIPLSIGIALNMAKFGHPYMFPLQDQIWTKISAQRRAALAANGGDLVSSNILPSTAVNYFRPDGIRFTGLFPFVTLPATVAQSYGGGYLDQTYRTGSVIDFMPLLSGLSVFGVIVTFLPRRSPGLQRTRLPMLAALAVPIPIMFYGYIAYRYTSEFMFVLVLGGAVGLVELNRRLAGRRRRTRALVLSGLAVLALFGIVANNAAALTTSRTTSQGAPLVGYIHEQQRIGTWIGHDISNYVSLSDDVPLTGPADRIQIVGDCGSVLVGTGDPAATWAIAEERDVAFQVDWLDQPDAEPADHDVTSRLTLARFVGRDVMSLELQRESGNLYRVQLVADDGTVVVEGDWRVMHPGDSVEFRISPDIDYGQFLVAAAGLALFNVSLGSVGSDTFALPRQVEASSPDAEESAPLGVAVTSIETPVPPLCALLRDGRGSNS